MAPTGVEGAGATSRSAEVVAAPALAESVAEELVVEETASEEAVSGGDEVEEPEDGLLEVLVLVDVEVVSPMTVETMLLLRWPLCVVSAFWTLAILRVAQ
jgi:hypothetical protein